MKRLYLLTIIGLLFCACHLNAQKVVTTSAQTASTNKLNGTRWKNLMAVSSGSKFVNSPPPSWF